MKQSAHLSLLALVAAFTLGAVFSDARAQPAGDPVEAYTGARLDLRLALVVPGRVARVLVEEGEAVEEGDPIVELADPEGEAQIRLLELRAASTLEEDAAEADHDLAAVREQMVKSAAERGGASEFEVREAALETVRARLAADLFTQRRREAELQLEQARRRHEQYTLRAPAAGVIDELPVEPGETVEALSPVARLVNADALIADVMADTASTLGLEPGRSASVEFRLGDRAVTAEGLVTYVAAVADAASDTRRVRVEIPNDRGLPAGTRVFVTFDRGAGAD